MTPSPAPLTERHPATTEDAVVEKLCQQMPDPIRMEHALAVANGRVTEAKRIILRYVVSKLKK